MSNYFKINYNINIYCRVLVFLTLGLSTSACGQQLKIVDTKKDYCRQLHGDSLQRMIELKSVISGIVYDLKYATRDNFTGKQLYRHGRYTFLRMAPAMALQKVQQELAENGMGLKIFDAYRPYRVTKKMWELVHDERYVANPSKGSGHNRGLSVDLTIIDLASGKELDMGTGFDNFSDTAHHDFKNLSPQVIGNRTILRSTMEKYGFRILSTEWWHYSWPNDRNYDVLDLEPSGLRKTCH